MTENLPIFRWFTTNSTIRRWWRSTIRSQKSFPERVKVNLQEESRKRIKNLNCKKVLTRLPMILAQIKVGINSYKLKNEIGQILYLLCQHNKITKKVYNNLIR